MASEKNITLVPLTQEQLVALQKEDEKTVILTMSKEQIEEAQILHEDYKNELLLYPNLQPDEKGKEFCKLLTDMERYKSEFLNKLEYTPLKSAVDIWLSKISDIDLRRKYDFFIEDMYTKQVIYKFFANGEAFTIGGLRHMRHQAVIDYIQKVDFWSEDEKKEIIVCYKELIAYFNKISYGWFNRAINDVYQMSPEIAEKTLSFSNWRIFIDTLYEINHRDSIISRLIVKDAKRISTILRLTIPQIDFENCTIHFFKKSKLAKGQALIQYSSSFMKELKEYIQSTTSFRKNSSYVFVTKNGKMVTRSRLNYSFAEASNKAGIQKVSPESLRGTWVAFTQQGWKEEIIMKRKLSKA